MLKKNGVISLIVKNTLVAATYTKAIRSRMSELNMKEIRDYSTVEVFKEADVYPIIFYIHYRQQRDLL